MAFEIKISNITVHLPKQDRNYRLECWEQLNEGQDFELITVLETINQASLVKTLQELLQYVE